MNRLHSIFIVFVFCCNTAGLVANEGTALTATPEKRLSEFSHKKQLMIRGYDVVSYHQPSGPVEGEAAYEVEHAGLRYRFASDTNMQTFLESPETYEPLYGGWCAYAMLDGGKTRIDPETYKLVDGKLLLFYNGLWGNTLEAWNALIVENSSDAALIQKADQHWMELLN